MTDAHARTIGWTFVVAQTVAIVAVVIVPHGDDWPTPRWVELIGYALLVGGLLVAFASSLALGSALTATPEPKPTDRLRTEGPYSLVRHPIYTGVLAIVAGIVVRSGNAVALVVGAAVAVLFVAKTSWEERRLAARYDDYAAYRATTGRFVPRPRRRRGTLSP